MVGNNLKFLDGGVDARQFDQGERHRGVSQTTPVGEIINVQSNRRIAQIKMNFLAKRILPSSRSMERSQFSSVRARSELSNLLRNHLQEG